MGTLFQNSGWDFILKIGAYTVPKNQLKPIITIEKTEDGSNIIDFDLHRINAPISFIDQIYKENQEIVFTYIQGDTVRRLITAKVDYPQLDLLNKRIHISGANNRDDLLEKKYASSVNSIGLYSTVVFGEKGSIAEQVKARLSTIPYSIDFDSYNNPMLTSWYAKEVPDFVFDSNDIIVRELDLHLDLQERQQIVNEINITLNYRRTRLYEIQRDFSWSAPYNGDSADYLLHLYSQPTISMILNAIKDTSWVTVNGPVFTNGYRPRVGLLGGYFGTTSATQLDANGDPIIGANGYKLVSNLPAEEKLNQDVMAAEWTMKKRFSQFIDEEFHLTVKAPQSQSKWGELSAVEKYAYEDEFDASPWENNERGFTIPANAVYDGDNLYFDLPETVAGKLNSAILCALHKAKTDILKTHRQTIVTFTVDGIIPNLELSHTVEINKNILSAKGKVVSIKFNLNTLDGNCSTTISLALFKMDEDPITETNLSAPARLTYTPTLTGPGIVLGSTYLSANDVGTAKQASELSGSELWNGFIGTKVVKYSSNIAGGDTYSYRPEFLNEYRVDTPPIGSYLRGKKILTQVADYTILIRNDDLTVDFT